MPELEELYYEVVREYKNHNKRLCAIFSITNNYDFGIGYKGDLAYRSKTDMQFFKLITMGHAVIMGDKTYDSLHMEMGLPGRFNIVISPEKSKNPQYLKYPKHKIVFIDNLVEALTIPIPYGYNQIDRFIIGGASIYAQYRDLYGPYDLMFVTDHNVDADHDVSLSDTLKDDLVNGQYHIFTDTDVFDSEKQSWFSIVSCKLKES